MDQSNNIAYTARGADNILDKLLAPGLKERMDNGEPTLKNADFSKGGMLDKFRSSIKLDSDSDNFKNLQTPCAHLQIFMQIF